MYIFLDIDGVLSPISTWGENKENKYNAFDKDCLMFFENAVRPFKDIKIVISSTWKLIHTLKEIRQYFSDDIQPLIVGMTPDTYGRTEPYERYSEVLAYLKHVDDEDAAWVAIDDDPEHFPDNCPVIITNPDKGIDESIADKLIGMIDGNL